jgi:integrase
MTGRRQFGAIRRLPSGRWQARYFDQEGEYHAAPSTFATKAEAARFLATVEADMARGTWRDPRAGDITFARWAQEYMDSAHHKRATTRTRDRNVLRAHLLPALGDRQLSEIRPLDLRRLVHAWSAELKPSTVRTIYGLLRTILKAAVEADVLAVTPCRGVRLPNEPPAERRFLEPEAVTRLATAIDERYRPMVYLAAVLGLRWSEVAGLRVRNVDFRWRTITVSASLAEGTGTPELADVKSRASRRTLTLPPFLAALLADHLQRRGLSQEDKDAFVFAAPDGGPLWARNFRSRFWDPAVKAAGLDGLTFHELRHTAAAILIAEGFHPKVIQQRLGHASVRTTMDIYGHLLESVDAGVTARLEAIFGERERSDDGADQAEAEIVMARQWHDARPEPPGRESGTSEEAPDKVVRLERTTGLEPATPTLARLCSTN